MTNSSASQISSFYSQSRANYLYSQVLRTPRLFELFKSRISEFAAFLHENGLRQVAVPVKLSAKSRRWLHRRLTRLGYDLQLILKFQNIYESGQHLTERLM